MDTAVTTLKFESKAVIPTDPRTKLFLTVTVSTIMITGDHKVTATAIARQLGIFQDGDGAGL